MEAYAKQIKDTESEIWLAEIKLRARRKFGELSKLIEKSKPGPNNEIDSGNAAINYSKKQTLDDVDISQREASRCENLATEKDKCEEAIAEARENNKPVTYADVEKMKR